MHLPTLKQLEHAAHVVQRAMQPTPQYAWPLLRREAGCEVWVKHENHTPTGAFKVRGGLVYFHALPQSGPKPAGRDQRDARQPRAVGRVRRARHDLPSRPSLPTGNSREKNDAMRALGATLIEHGDDFQAAREHANELAEAQGLHMVPSFHPFLVQGVASYALELLQAQPDLDRSCTSPSDSAPGSAARSRCARPWA